jgi:hypothetical protein
MLGMLVGILTALPGAKDPACPWPVVIYIV